MEAVSKIVSIGWVRMSASAEKGLNKHLQTTISAQVLAFIEIPIYINTIIT